MQASASRPLAYRFSKVRRTNHEGNTHNPTRRRLERTDFFNPRGCVGGLPEFCPTADHERLWEGTERHSEILQVLATPTKHAT